MQDINIEISAEFLQLIAEIEEFKGKWALFKTSAPERLTLLRKTATVESVASSTRIEGVTLSNQEVEKILSNLEQHSFTTRDEQEVAGYAEAMDLVFEAFEDMAISENHIKQLHAVVLKYSEKDVRHRGQYKTLSNNIVAFDGGGKQIGIIFETATPFDTPRKMEALVHWTQKALAEKTYHDLLIIAVFIVVFLAIHPFQDGNGRLSRVLTTLLMLRSNYTYVAYSSLESIIEENKDLYYSALRRTQTTLEDELPNWESWIGFFLRALKKQTQRLAGKLEDAVDESDMPTLSLQILHLLEEKSRMGISEIGIQTSANKNTIKLHLRNLVKSGHISQHGKGPATWYEKVK